MISLFVIIVAILFGLTGLLLSLFSCELDLHEDTQVQNAKLAIRYILITLTGTMITELLLRAVSIGILRFFANIWHIFDIVILVGVVLVECTLSEPSVSDATSLVISLRLIKIIKLISGIGSLNQRSRANYEDEVKILKSKITDLESRLYESKCSDHFYL